MSTLLINSSCEEGFGSSSNPVSRLTNAYFTHRNGSSLLNHREHQEDIKFRIKNPQDDEHFSAAAWESFSNSWDNENNTNANNSVDFDEEYRQEWSDEHLTDAFIKGHGLNQFFYDFSTSFQGHGGNGVKQSSLYQKEGGHLTEEFQQSNMMNEVYHSSDSTVTIFQTDHDDLHQAYIHLLDHLLVSLVSQSCAAAAAATPHQNTRKPCPEAEWDWEKLFSSSRWEERDPPSQQRQQLQDVAQQRLELFMGHLMCNLKKEEEKKLAEWESEFLGS
ncbi:11742_t:CDS:1 [Ambispora leptoticha]|uniref:11742_t:CDS:1 n=1 Tax=Ambispora leptoticha TaxID=144679 RepID=A0A9N8ZJ52_9GLOM|nr:11742_t:CDS:1 [Ambispora leptoticha]